MRPSFQVRISKIAEVRRLPCIRCLLKRNISRKESSPAISMEMASRISCLPAIYPLTWKREERTPDRTPPEG